MHRTRSDLSSLPHFAGDSPILQRNTVSLPLAKVFRNLSLCLKFEKFTKQFLPILVIPVFAAYSFLLPFFTFFMISLKVAELHEPIRHRFGSHLCFLIVNEKSQKQNKAKTPMRVLSYNKQKWLTC